MDGSKYVSDGKCDGSATKYVQPCASYSQRSLDCLMENDGDKDMCGSKCIKITTLPISQKRAKHLFLFRSAAFFEDYKNCRKRVTENRFKTKVPVKAAAAAAADTPTI